jgi:hypothetical protein
VIEREREKDGDRVRVSEQDKESGLMLKISKEKVNFVYSKLAEKSVDLSPPCNWDFRVSDLIFS